MKTLTATIVLASLALAGTAAAKPRKAAPVVCESYAIVVDDAADGRMVAVCYDKRVEGGLVLRYYTEMTVEAPGGPRNVVVGYR
jgi:hypothetical protein